MEYHTDHPLIKMMNHKILPREEVKEMEEARDLEGLLTCHARLFLKICKKLGPDCDLDELFSESMLYCMRKFDKFDPSRGRFYFFAYWAVRTSVNKLRQSRKTIYTPILSPPIDCDYDITSMSVPVYDRPHRDIDVMDYMRRLPKKEYQAVYYRECTGMTLSRVAKKIDTSIEWARYLSLRGKARMREMMTADGYTRD